MKAMVYTRYGSPKVLSIADLEQPVPKDGQVLVKVHGASVNSGDWRLLTGTPWPVRAAYGFSAPKHTVLGADVAGHVVALGNNVQLEVGMRSSVICPATVLAASLKVSAPMLELLPRNQVSSATKRWRQRRQPP